MSSDPPELHVGEERKGSVVNWLSDGRYGFIRVDHADRDLFVHRQELPGDLAALYLGARVRFVVAQDREGRLFASHVELLPRHQRAAAVDVGEQR